MKQYARLARIAWVSLGLRWVSGCVDAHDDIGLNGEDPLALTEIDAGVDGGLQAGAYAEVYALMQTHCVSCHGAGKPLDLSSPELARSELLGVPAEYKACAVVDGGAPKVRVVAGSPDASLLMEKLSAAPSCGKPMPPTAPLPEADVATFRAWIAGGAKP